MITLGESILQDMYLGDEQILEAWLGEHRVYPQVYDFTFSATIQVDAGAVGQNICLGIIRSPNSTSPISYWVDYGDNVKTHHAVLTNINNTPTNSVDSNGNLVTDYTNCSGAIKHIYQTAGSYTITIKSVANVQSFRCSPKGIQKNTGPDSYDWYAEPQPGSDNNSWRYTELLSVSSPTVTNCDYMFGGLLYALYDDDFTLDVPACTSLVGAFAGVGHSRNNTDREGFALTNTLIHKLNPANLGGMAFRCFARGAGFHYIARELFLDYEGRNDSDPTDTLGKNITSLFEFARNMNIQDAGSTFGTSWGQYLEKIKTGAIVNPHFSFANSLVYSTMYYAVNRSWVPTASGYLDHFPQTWPTSSDKDIPLTGLEYDKSPLPFDLLWYSPLLTDIEGIFNNSIRSWGNLDTGWTYKALIRRSFFWNGRYCGNNAGTLTNIAYAFYGNRDFVLEPDLFYWVKNSVVNATGVFGNTYYIDIRISQDHTQEKNTNDILEVLGLTKGTCLDYWEADKNSGSLSADGIGNTDLVATSVRCYNAAGKWTNVSGMFAVADVNYWGFNSTNGMSANTGHGVKALDATGIDSYFPNASDAAAHAHMLKIRPADITTGLAGWTD